MSERRHPELQCDGVQGRCQVCADEALVGRVVHIEPATRLGVVEFGTATSTVALDLVDASIGDEVLVHAGFAIERVRPDE